MDEKTMDEMNKRHIELKLRQVELENEGQKIRNEQSTQYLEFAREKQIAEMQILERRLQQEQQHFDVVRQANIAQKDYWEFVKNKKIAPH